MRFELSNVMPSSRGKYMLTIEMTDERGRSATRDQIDTLCANGFDAEGITKKGAWWLIQMIRCGIMLVPRSGTAKRPPT